jgi:hypothetical protein
MNRFDASAGILDAINETQQQGTQFLSRVRAYTRSPVAREAYVRNAQHRYI